jgi:hypothetical protein
VKGRPTAGVAGTIGSVSDVELERGEVVLLQVKELWWRFFNAVEVSRLKVEVR